MKKVFGDKKKEKLKKRLLREEVGHTVDVVVWVDCIVRAEEFLLSGDTREGQTTRQTIVLSEQNVSVEAIPDHADLFARDAVFGHNVIDHEGGRFADQSGFLTGAAFNSTDH